jgi:group I intron endonuclease
MIGIYKITSPSNKIYIGQSTDIEKRFSQYLKLNCKFQKRLFNSFTKYGVENHKFEILTLCYEEQLSIFERDFQEAYDVIGKNGLNCILTNTSSLKKILSEETRIKMSNSRIGFKFSDESKLKMSIAKKGRKRTEKELKSYELYHSSKSKPIICTKTNKEWYSLRKCAKEHGISKSILSNYLNGKNPNKTTLIYKNS